MAVDPALLALTKPIEQFTPWPRPKCPSCDTGHIHFAEPDELQSEKSKTRCQHPDSEPDWISGTFSVVGQCDNPACRQDVHGSGNYQIAYTVSSYPPREYNYQGADYVAFYTLAHLHPPLRLMSIPEFAPDQVREGIMRAARCWFVDPGLAATALRATIELFMTTEGISAVNPDGNFASAHSRIKKWLAQDRAARDSIARLLLAVKWLGNDGTHEDAHLTRQEVYAGARMLDFAFDQLFVGPDLDEQARAIDAAKTKK